MKEEISLKLIFDIIKSKIVLILSAMVVLAVSTAVITKFYITPKYTSSIKLCVVSDLAIADDNTTIASLRNEILYVKDVIETCIEAINTGDAYREMNEKLRVLDPSYENKQVSSSVINIAQVGSSNMLRITATTSDPALSYDVCRAFEQMASERIPKVGNVRIELMDSPTVASAPSSPNIMKNSVIGALAGFVLCAAVVILIEMLDTTVKDGEETARQLDILLLAEIPDIYSTKDPERYSEHKLQSTNSRGNAGKSSGKNINKGSKNSDGGTKNGR